VTDRAKLTKVLDGVYEVGTIRVYRNFHRTWFLDVELGVLYRTRAAAVIAARVYLGEEIDPTEDAILRAGVVEAL
jgi:hypothetical protein